MEGGSDYYENGGGTIKAGRNYTVQADGTIRQPISGGNGSYAVYKQGARTGDSWDLYDANGHHLGSYVFKSDGPMELFARP